MRRDTASLSINQPERYAELLEPEKAALLEWIRLAVRPASRFRTTVTSYGLKHCFEEVGFYVTNGEFKGAMEASGYEGRPREPHYPNDVYRIKPFSRGFTLDHVGQPERAHFDALVQEARAALRAQFEKRQEVEKREGSPNGKQ